MIIKGFRFGMLLQIAIGPVCLFLFKTASMYGIPAALAGVFAATIADTLFVTLAITGIGAVLNKPKVTMALKYFGTIVLIYFGLGIILGSFGINIIPSLNNNASPHEAISKAFFTSFILTISSPLSILFWTGVFATKITNDGFNKADVIAFGTGAVLATLIFLSILVTITGLFLRSFILESLVVPLNVIVGLILIGFGIKMAFKKISPAV